MAHVPRLYIPGHLAPGPLRLDREQSRRLSAVMRLKVGDEFLVFCGDGREWRATAATIGNNGIEATVTGVTRQEAMASLALELWCGLVRPNRFDWAIEKCVEAGVDVIRPLVSEFAVRGERASNARQERWTRIAVEAAEQSGRLHLPVVEPPRSFDAMLAAARHLPLLITAVDGRPWPEVQALLPASGALAVVIGPEGGLSESELNRARAQGALVASLGPHVLRTETAAVIATGLIRSVS